MHASIPPAAYPPGSACLLAGAQRARGGCTLTSDRVCVLVWVCVGVYETSHKWGPSDVGCMVSLALPQGTSRSLRVARMRALGVFHAGTAALTALMQWRLPLAACVLQTATARPACTHGVCIWLHVNGLRMHVGLVGGRPHSAALRWSILFIHTPALSSAQLQRPGCALPYGRALQWLRPLDCYEPSPGAGT